MLHLEGFRDWFKKTPEQRIQKVNTKVSNMEDNWEEYFRWKDPDVGEMFVNNLFDAINELSKLAKGELDDNIKTQMAAACDTLYRRINSITKMWGIDVDYYVSMMKKFDKVCEYLGLGIRAPGIRRRF